MDPTDRSASHPRSGDVPNLDVLRAVAVLLVVVDHSAKFLGLVSAPWINVMGGTGVYLFFVHTCLVLMLSLERQRAKNSGSLSTSFYIRRAFRIYPLSVFFVLLVTTFSIPAKSVAGPFAFNLQPPELKNIVSNLALVMNMTTGAVPILGQLWSLPFEVQMYLLLPAAFLLARRYGTRGLVALCIAGAVAGTAYALLAEVIPGFWRASLLLYVPCFLPGVLAYTLWDRRPRIPAGFWLPTVLILAGSYIAIGGAPASWALCFLVGAGVPFFRQVRSRWLTVPAHEIAKYSYGIYLSHTLALWIGFNLFGGARLLQVAIWLLALTLLPVAAYHWIEAPFIGYGVRLAGWYSRWRSAPAHESPRLPQPAD